MTQDQPKNDGPKKKRFNKNRNRNRNRRYGKGKPSNLNPIDKIEKSYLNLIEKHLACRKKYFELYHRADPKQLAKLERLFYQSLQELRDYEVNLKPEMQELYQKKYNNLENDSDYSNNHQIPFQADKVEDDTVFEDPHYLESQKQSEWAQDTEESSGTMDDYRSYKGI